MELYNAKEEHRCNGVSGEEYVILIEKEALDADIIFAIALIKYYLMPFDGDMRMATFKVLAENIALLDIDINMAIMKNVAYPDNVVQFTNKSANDKTITLVNKVLAYLENEHGITIPKRLLELNNNLLEYVYMDIKDFFICKTIDDLNPLDLNSEAYSISLGLAIDYSTDIIDAIDRGSEGTLDQLGFFFKNVYTCKKNGSLASNPINYHIENLRSLKGSE